MSVVSITALYNKQLFAIINDNLVNMINVTEITHKVN